MSPHALNGNVYSMISEELHTPVIGDILDSMGRMNQFLPQGISPLVETHVLVGRAMPVLIADVFGPQREPFGRLTEALDQLEPGEIYLACSGKIDCSAWGEILTVTAKARGANGAVIDGFHRDTKKILDENWPVFSRGNYAQDAGVRSSVLDYRTNVVIGGVQIRPGDLMVGDIDGIVVIPADVEQEVVEMALDKVRMENIVRKAIEEGMTSTEAFARFGVL